MRLGPRQVEVLRAAQSGELVCYDDGGWSDGHRACTRPAQSLWRLGLLVEGPRMVTVTWGSWRERHGWYVRLSGAGRDALDVWDLAHPEAAVARMRRDELARAIARSSRPITDMDILALAARDETLSDDAFVALRQTMGGES